MDKVSRRALLSLQRREEGGNEFDGLVDELRQFAGKAMKVLKLKRYEGLGVVRTDYAFGRSYSVLCLEKYNQNDAYGEQRLSMEHYGRDAFGISFDAGPTAFLEDGFPFEHLESYKIFQESDIPYMIKWGMSTLFEFKANYRNKLNDEKSAGIDRTCIFKKENGKPYFMSENTFENKQIANEHLREFVGKVKGLFREQLRDKIRPQDMEKIMDYVPRVVDNGRICAIIPN